MLNSPISKIIAYKKRHLKDNYSTDRKIERLIFASQWSLTEALGVDKFRFNCGVIWGSQRTS